jgi:DNA polymerase III delta subunit
LGPFINIGILENTRIFLIRNPQQILKKIDLLDTNDIVYIHIHKGIKSIPKETIAKYEPFKYIKSQFEKAKININDNTINQIIDVVGDNKITLQNEIQKCIYYIYPKKEISNINDIKDILSENDNTIIWNITNALISNNKNLMIKELSKLISQNEDLYMIVSMIARQLYIILLIHIYQDKPNQQIVTILKEKPFSINISVYGVIKTKENLYRFPESKIKEIYHRVLKLITLVNNGKIDMSLSLLILFLTI